MKMEKTLVIVPHEDDELSVAGQLLISLNKNRANKNYVVFTTNGDSDSFVGESRIKEAINSLKVLGVEEKNIFFLGYGSEWNYEKHIYNCEAEKSIVSKGGFRKTYAIQEHPEYSYVKYGLHHLYTRDNFKYDLMNLISDLEPTFIVCVDYDSHVDHRATSLLFEECMGEILKRKKDYRPIIWKKFAYLGAWNGPKDYYMHNVTVNTYNDDKTDNPIFSWNDRIKIGVENSCKTQLLRKNIIYRAALCHKSQNAWLNVQRMCNDDVVYWKRNVNNYLLGARVSATSGNFSCLNDFVITNSADIRKRNSVLNDEVIWHPTDELKAAIFELYEPVNAEKIVFYENPLPKDNINNILIIVNDNHYINTGELNHTGAPSTYKLEYEGVKKLEIRIEDCEGEFPGLLEVELLAYQEKERFPEGIREYQGYTREEISNKIPIIMEYWLLRLKAFTVTLLFPNYYVIGKKYSIVHRKKFLLPYFWVINLIRRK